MKRFARIFAALTLVLAMLAASVPVHADNPNLINNPSAETAINSQPQSWTTNYWGTLSASFSYADTGHTGGHSLYVDVTSHSSGDAKWMADQVAVTAGQTYTYSDYNRSNVDTELDAAYTDATGNMSFVYLDTIPASDDWQQTTSSLTVPGGVVSVSVYHIVTSVGWLQTDDFSLSAQTPASEPEQPVPTPATNLLANPSFETTNGSNPANWERGGWGANTSALTYLSGDAHSGTRSVQVSLSSYTDGDAKWYADPVSVTAGTTYNYQDYYKSAVATRVVLALTNTDGVDSYLELASAPVATDWTLYTNSFTVPTGIKALTIYHLLDQVGTLTLDDVELSAASTTAPVGTNPVANPSFETANGSNPSNWLQDHWGTNTANFSYVSGDAHSGTRSAKVTVTNYQSGDAKWYFKPLTTLAPGSQYSFSAWYKTNVQPHVVVTYADAAGVDHYFNLSNPVPAADAAANWQQYQTTFDVPTDARSLSIFFLIADNGWLQTDDYVIAPYNPAGFSEPLISLTFDDGWSSIYTNGLPLLQKYGFVSTQYLISGKLNTSQYMTTAMAQAFLSAGSEIASHTVTHPDLTQLSSSQLADELGNSQSVLRQLFGSSVATDFASPYGTYNSTVVTAIQQYYQSHRSTDAGFNSKDDFNPYNIHVQNVETDTTPAEVADWVAKAKADNNWLVLVFHQVSDSGDPDDYAVSPANLDTELANIKASGVSVKTISQALAEINSQL